MEDEPLGFAELHLADIIQNGRLVDSSAAENLEPEPEPEHMAIDVLGDNALGQAAEATVEAVQAGVQQTMDLAQEGLSQTFEVAGAVETELENQADQLMRAGGLGSLQSLKDKLKPGAAAGYSLLAMVDDEDEAAGEESSDGGDDDDDADADVPVLGRYKSDKMVVYASAAAAAEALGFSLKQVVSCCENETFCSDFHARTGYTFKIAEEPRGKKERDPEWRVGRRKALDELETVHEINAFSTLVLSSPDADAPCPGKLKVLVTITERTDSMAPPQLHDIESVEPEPEPEYIASVSAIPSTQLMMPALVGLARHSVRPCDVIVRFYAVRAFALTAKDAGNTSDPYVMATIDDDEGEPQVGVWPKGAVVDGSDLGGKEVEIDAQRNTLNPHFGKIFEWHIQLPGPSLKIVVKDFDDIWEGGVDDVIGETEIDLEDRYFSNAWRSLGPHPDGYDMKFPIEQRDLMGESGVTQGAIECWVEIFSQRDMPLYPVMDISAPQKQKFELRVIVWDATDMKPMDTIGDMNDLYITGALSYRDHKNKLKEKKQTTDIHWRSSGGKGSFNYRLIYKDLELPMTMPGAGESEFPRFVVKAFDQDIIGGADMIGTEQVPEIKELFRRGWRKFEMQQNRDHEMDKMSVDQLRSEARRMYDAMLRKTTVQLNEANAAVPKDKARITSLLKQQAQQSKNRQKVDDLAESKLRAFLVDNDSTRQLENTAVSFPEPSSKWVQHKLKGGGARPRIYYQHVNSKELTQEPPMEGIQKQVFVDPAQGPGVAAKFMKVFERAGRHDAERDKGIRMWDVEKQHQPSASASGTEPESRYALIPWKEVPPHHTAPHTSHIVLVLGCSGASTATGVGGFWRRITGGGASTPGRFDAVVTMRGPDDKSSDSEEDEAADGGADAAAAAEAHHGGVQWTEVGKVYLQFELLPQALADERNCGHGRSEPNRFPELPKPVGRVKFSLNPFSMLSALIGPELTRQICMPIGVCCCCIAVVVALYVLNMTGMLGILIHLL